MLKGFSAAEYQFILDVLSGTDKKYSPSYASRLRTRCLQKSIGMIQELLLFHQAWIHGGYNRIHKTFNFNNDTYYQLLEKLQALPLFPETKKSEETKEDIDDSVSEE